MNVLEAINGRRSIRKYEYKETEHQTIVELLEAARWAPSGGNVQPWYFEVLAGDALVNVKARLVEKATTWDGHDYAEDAAARGALAAVVERQESRLFLRPPAGVNVGV